jgi:hypothetical protein
MNDERLREAYERGLPVGNDAPTLDDVQAERLRLLVEREGSEGERLRTLDMMLSTAEGRRELDIAWAAARAARPHRRSWQGFAVAASLVLVCGTSVVWMARRQHARDVDVLRGVESPITLVAPVGLVAAPRATHFAWRPIARAERYQLVVVDTTGAELYAIETRDTALALPDSVRLAPGRTYLWWVQATLADHSTVTAVTQRLVVAPR